MAQS
jgi:hypothetical protein